MPVKNSNKKTRKSKKSKRIGIGLTIRILAFTLILLSLPAAYILSRQNQDIRQQASSPYNNCQEEDVNTEFRPYEEGTDKPWMSGDKMTVSVGDKIDVNCFAKTGTALLSNGKISLKVDGVATTIPDSNIINNGRSLRAFAIDTGGVYEFTCSNSSCLDADSISVPKDQQVVCTADAKQCPDGSFVSRTGPDCSFAPCPGTEKCAKDSNGEIQCPVWDLKLLNCEGGKQVPGIVDECGCQQPPKCEYPGGECPNPSVADLNNDCKVNLSDYDLFLSEFIKGKR